MSIKIENLDYVYSPGTAYEMKALSNINLEIKEGEFVAIIGHTGSGKSTLIQHLNGLLSATSGKIYFNGEDIYAKNYDLRALRCKVGLAFQYPDYQLFEENVLKDVCFGPKNQGLSDDEAKEKAKAALKSVGMDKSVYGKSPFELSGGQKKRVAIAGILAMEPEVLILDEPTAGLDPIGRDSILDMVATLRKERGITVILVSHSMEDVAKYADRIIVMNKGSVAYDGTPAQVFKNYKELKEIGLMAPQVTYILHDLKEAEFNVDTSVTTLDGAVDEILKCLKNQE